MLAEQVDLNLLRYPLIASPKLDGVRATFVDGKLLTRNLKPLGNRAIQQISFPYPLDGELIVGDPTSKSCFRDTMSVVSSHDADAKDVRFHVFDIVNLDAFKNRLFRAHDLTLDQPFMLPVSHVNIVNERELLIYEEIMLNHGYEGVMIRDPEGKYKFGRSTAREGALLKLKRKLTSEAEVLGFIEQMHNANEAKVDNLGYTERSSHQANMIPMGVLGALAVKDLKSGVMFNIGTGFTAEDRAYIWGHRKEYMGAVASYEYLPVGVKDKPRHPVFMGWRMRSDL